MKKRIAAATLLLVLQVSIPVFAFNGVTADRGSTAALSTGVFGGFAERCQVITRGGNLNVRNEYGVIIAKLPNRTWVTVLGRSGDMTRISVTVRRRYIRGMVASEFLGYCF